MIGIYQIRNKITGGRYIGQSVDVESRLNANHKKDLRLNRHSNILLQNSYNKHGEDAFAFELIEECSKSELNEREICWIKFYRQKGVDVYNITDGGTGGDTWKGMTQEHRDMLKLKPRKPISKEARQRAGKSISLRWKDPEFRASQIAKRTGLKRSEETKQNISSALKGNRCGCCSPDYVHSKHTEETKQKISLSNKGRKHTECSKKKISEAMKKIRAAKSW